MSNDLEYQKFSLYWWKVIVNTSIVTAWNNITTETRNDLENQKFDTNWNVRLAITL